MCVVRHQPVQNKEIEEQMVEIARGKHLFPFRTEQ